MVIDNIKNTEIKPSERHGQGLFATETIPKDTLLCALRGQVMLYSDYQALITDGSHDITYFMEKFRVNEAYIAAIPFRTKYSYINHDETANVYSQINNAVLYVYALNDIQKGEELVDVYDLDRHIDVLGGFAKK